MRGARRPRGGALSGGPDRATTAAVGRLRDDELDALVGLVVAQQADPHRAVPYLGADAAGVRAELGAVAEVVARTRVVRDRDGDLVGALTADVDHDMGRAWHLGPFVALDDPAAWAALADRLLAAVRGEVLAPLGIAQEEACSTTPASGQDSLVAAWAERGGLRAEPPSVAMTGALAAIVVDAAAQRAPVRIRPAAPDDADAIAALHDASFPATHTDGRALVASRDARRRLLVAGEPGEVLGHVAHELQPDGSGYVDYLAVVPTARGRGIGRALAWTACLELSTLGAEHVHLTVLADNAAARALYRSLGFEEDIPLVPHRRGFTQLPPTPG